MRTTYLISLLMMSATLGVLGVSATAEVPQKAARSKVALQSVYLTEPIDTARQVSIEGELGGKAQVILDRNLCTLNQFGDTQSCTRMFIAPVEVKLTQLRLADPSGKARRIFRLEGQLEPDGSQYFLILPQQGKDHARLVVNFGENTARVITLEPIQTSN